MYSTKFPLKHITLTQKYLSVCATSSASERLFNTLGNAVTPSRSSLKPDKVNMITILASIFINQQVDIRTLISKNQALQILYLKHHAYYYSTPTQQLTHFIIGQPSYQLPA